MTESVDAASEDDHRNKPSSMEELYAAIEFRAKAELQLASYCEKLIVFGAGGLAGGVTVASAIAAKLGKLEGYSFLINSAVSMGIATAGAILLHLSCSTGAYIDLRTTAAAKLDLSEISGMTRSSSPIRRRLRSFFQRLGEKSNSLKSATRRLYIAATLGIILFNGFVQYVVFVILNLRRIPH